MRKKLQRATIFEGTLEMKRIKPIPPLDCQHNCKEYIQSNLVGIARRNNGASNVMVQIEHILEHFNGRFVRFIVEFESEPKGTSTNG
ncbi:MAG: hypothetical protein M1469_01085 [Bacteroidetes bacterium]|nr:hypothetical protein [Bacteroidota bacterium]